MLTLSNGIISYSVDTTAEFEIMTIATHSCNAGSTLVGAMTRTCMQDDQADAVGEWSGSPPSCNRKNFQN